MLKRVDADARIRGGCVWPASRDLLRGKHTGPKSLVRSNFALN